MGGPYAAVLGGVSPSRFIIPVRFAVAVLLPALAVVPAGCQTMKPMGLDQLSGARPAKVWVTRTDRSVIVLTDPQIVNNRLAGFQDDVYQVFPADEVRQIAVRRIAAGRTAALVATGAAGAFALMWALSGTEDYTHPCARRSTDDCDPSVEPASSVAAPR